MSPSSKPNSAYTSHSVFPENKRSKNNFSCPKNLQILIEQAARLLRLKQVVLLFGSDDYNKRVLLKGCKRAPKYNGFSSSVCARFIRPVSRLRFIWWGYLLERGSGREVAQILLFRGILYVGGVPPFRGRRHRHLQHSQILRKYTELVFDDPFQRKRDRTLVVREIGIPLPALNALFAMFHGIRAQQGGPRAPRL